MTKHIRCGVLLVTMALMATSLSACRMRVDLSVVPGGETTQTTTAESHGDEMASYAWEVYSAAIQAEQKMDTYSAEYEGHATNRGTTTTSHAHITRAADGDHVQWLVQMDNMQGYFADGVGYFQNEGNRVWTFTDESGFLERMGFSNSPVLTEVMFQNALVTENDDGTRVVSCPLDGEYAAAYAKQMIALSGIGSATVDRAEVTVVVNEDGTPLSFGSSVSVSLMGYWKVSRENITRYVAVGDDVVLTPPSDLDSYREDEGLSGK